MIDVLAAPLELNEAMLGDAISFLSKSRINQENPLATARIGMWAAYCTYEATHTDDAGYHAPEEFREFIENSARTVLALSQTRR